MAQAKKAYDVYRVAEYSNGLGDVTVRRTFAGRTMAVSAKKARANVEFRMRGKAIYGGEDEYDFGGDAYMTVWYEAVESED